MVDYVKLAATAKRLIDANGRAISIVPRSLADPSKPWLGTVDDTPVPAIGVFTEYNRRDIDGTKIQRSDQELSIAADGLAVDIENVDAVLDGATTWQVVDTTVVKPGPIVLVYKLQVRA